MKTTVRQPVTTATCTWAIRLADGSYVTELERKATSYDLGSAHLWLCEERAAAAITGQIWLRHAAPVRARP